MLIFAHGVYKSHAFWAPPWWYDIPE